MKLKITQQEQKTKGVFNLIRGEDGKGYYDGKNFVPLGKVNIEKNKVAIITYYMNT